MDAGAVQLVLLLVGAFLIGFSAGLAGFADALIASAVWLHVLPPVEAVPLVFLSGIFVHAVSIAFLRRALEPARVAPFLVGGLLGTPLGVWALPRIDPEPFRVAVGAFLIVVCAGQLLRLARRGPSTRSPAPDGPAIRLADGGVGFVGGGLGGLSGLSGVLPTLWCSVRGWPPEVQRAVYQPYILCMHLLALGLSFAAGSVQWRELERFGWCLPFLAAGLWLGLRLFGRIDERAFRVAVLGLLLASGAALLW